ncbi:hypothetical protein L8956_16680 [Peribacillus frigoritolerans]|nr:hypothetical protein L8956_16680 [Peribacillus frigoritolerans]
MLISMLLMSLLSGIAFLL